MSYSKVHRSLDAFSSLFFLLLIAFLIYMATQIKFHDGNYSAFYLGGGVVLESVYAAVRFGLRAVLSSRPRLADRISEVVGLLVIVPVGLVILILALLAEQALRHGHTFGLVLAALVFSLLVVPALLIVRDLILSFMRANAARSRDSNPNYDAASTAR